MTAPLLRLKDGTVKQVSPLTGTIVWTVPGRAHRPLPAAPDLRRAVDEEQRDAWCAFCARHYLRTTPERSRVVLEPAPRLLEHVPASALFETVAELRRIGNLFEILPVSYWRANHGYVVPDEVVDRARAYLAEPEGRAHLLALLTVRSQAAGAAAPGAVEPVRGELLAQAVDLFAGSHDVIVARRHLVDGARFTDELAGSGTLTPAEHARFWDLTIDTTRDLYRVRPQAAYVATFQNWLAPAGASFDHLHKQVVAIDEYGPQVERERERLRADPEVFNHAVLDVAVRNGLVVARNEHAVAVAGVGHRYPALEVYATGREQLPWEHGAAQRRAVSDLVHAMHAAAGVHTPSNEEWHYRPPAVEEPMPWRVVLKWRVSTLAGFEGGTRINVNTIDPWSLRERVVDALVPLRASGAVAPMALGDECDAVAGMLRYAEASGARGPGADAAADDDRPRRGVRGRGASDVE